MNVERMHRILFSLYEDIQENSVQKHLPNIITHLQNQINQSNQPAHQTNLVKALTSLYKSLGNSEYNNYPPGWLEIIKELYPKDIFGNELKTKIENIFSVNTITPAKALEDIKNINLELTTFLTAAKNILDGFSVLNIEKDELVEGMCEFGYMIPREYIENDLSSFNNEVSELNFILSHISEVIMGDKNGYKIKTISSSNFLIYIVLGLQVANFLSKAIDSILSKYKTILEIKTLRAKLVEKGVPETETSGVEDYSNQLMADEIEKIVSDLMKSHSTSDNGRNNELRTGIQFSLNKLANRIDNGFNVEIRIKPIESNYDENEDSDFTEEEIKLSNQIFETSKKIEYQKNISSNILSLSEKLE